VSAVLAERAYDHDRGEAASICSAPRSIVLGCAIDAVTLEDAVDAIENRIVQRESCQHVAINAAKVVRLQHDAQLRDVITGCELVTADGQAVVWAARILGRPLPGRVTGIDLMDAVAQRASERGYRVYVLGARQEVLERAVGVLRTRFPALQLAGYRHGYFDAEGEPEVVDSIAEAAPDVLFVALETPAKELFLARNRDRLRIPFVMGVGGAVDVLGGVRRRAPRWMQRLGLEWMFRLAQDPSRLAGRYVVGNTRFTWLVARELVRQRFAR
jgi:N-acetylglucosaminyldiphosphoundecaprenol N-acetyl-beta-D-mannosaminyltransferase